MKSSTLTHFYESQDMAERGSFWCESSRCFFWNWTLRFPLSRQIVLIPFPSLCVLDPCPGILPLHLSFPCKTQVGDERWNTLNKMRHAGFRDRRQMWNVTELCGLLQPAAVFYYQIGSKMSSGQHITAHICQRLPQRMEFCIFASSLFSAPAQDIIETSFKKCFFLDQFLGHRQEGRKREDKKAQTGCLSFKILMHGQVLGFFFSPQRRIKNSLFIFNWQLNAPKKKEAPCDKYLTNMYYFP